MDTEAQREVEGGRVYEAPAISELGTIDQFTLGDRDSVLDEPTP
jgi:hypothetical protein